MTAPRLDLSPSEGEWLADLLAVHPAAEVRLLVRVRGGRVVRAVRTDLGPVDLPGPGPRVHAARDLRSWPPARGAGRIVLVDDDTSPDLAQLPAAAALGCRADPDWIPGLSLLRTWMRRLRLPRAWLLPDGAYVLLRTDAEGALAGCAAARVRNGRVECVLGSSALDLGPAVPGRDALLASLRSRVGTPRLVLAGTAQGLGSILHSATPAKTLDRARIRGELQVLRWDARFALLWLALRLGWR